MSGKLPCSHCSKDPCVCELPGVDLDQLRDEVRRMFYNGHHLNRIASAYTVAWLIKKLDEAKSMNRKIVCSYCGHIDEADTREKAVAVMADHIVNCPRHPMNRVIEAIEEAVKQYRIRLMAVIGWLKEERSPELSHFQHMLRVQAQVIEEDMIELDKKFLGVSTAPSVIITEQPDQHKV